MIAFDPHTSPLLIDDVVIAPDPRAADVLGAFANAQVTEGQGDLRIVTVRDASPKFVLNFTGDRLQSGCFWISLPDPGGWDDAERDEARRGEAHRLLMIELFGAETWRDARLVVEPMFDTKTYLQIISFAPVSR